MVEEEIISGPDKKVASKRWNMFCSLPVTELSYGYCDSRLKSALQLVSGEIHVCRH